MNLGRLNPAYLEIACRKAIVHEMIDHLTSKYTTAMGGSSPARLIKSDDVFGSENAVSEESIIRYIQELQQEEEGLRLELLKFDFVRKDDVKPTRETPRQGSPAPSSPPRRKGKRGDPARQ